MESEDVEIDILMAKRFGGTLSAEEEFRLEMLLKENPKTLERFDYYNKLWKTSGNLKIAQGSSRDERWQTLSESIEKDMPRRSRSGLKVVFRYAAVFAGILLVAYFLLIPPSPAVIEIRTAYGETKTAKLPDQSMVTLNAGTTVRYDPYSWDEERKLELEGEAFFVVTKSEVPFIVDANSANVRVLGTSFNVRSRNAVTTVSCVTGKVTVSKRTDERQSVILTKGLGVTADSLILSTVYHVVSDQVTGWIRGDLHFENAPLEDVFSEIERHFNKSIVLKKETGSKTFTGWFKKPQLDNMLETVCLSAGLTYSIRPDSVIVVQ